MIENLPEDLRCLVKTARFERDTIGCSNSYVYKVIGIAAEKCAYLKIQEPIGNDDLKREKLILEWLKGRLPVPEVLYFGQKGNMQYLLISEVLGLNAAHEYFVKSLTNAKAMVKMLAKGLQMIHSVDISRCPFDRRLDVTLAEALRRIEFKLVGEHDFEPENIGQRPSDIYAELLKTRPKTEDLVFTHGDYCLPNIILKDGTISGFIDLGRAGIADRYQDLALAARSINHNLGYKELVEIFFEEYGLKEIDMDKVKYYILLDELF